MAARSGLARATDGASEEVFGSAIGFPGSPCRMPVEMHRNKKEEEANDEKSA